MFRRSAQLLCGVAVGLSVLSGVAYAAPDGDDRGGADTRGADDRGADDRGVDTRGADDRGGAASRGRAEQARCEGSEVAGRDDREGGGDGRERGTRSARNVDVSDSDESDSDDRDSDDRGSDGREGSDERAGHRGYRASCGGRGGEPGLNSSGCGSSLLPAGVSLAPCAAPAARRGQDG